MRRLTLGALVLGGGAILALPFRKPVVIEPAASHSVDESGSGDLFNDDSLELLVREVTQGVEVPVVYHPQTDYTPSADASPRPSPLTYEDLAVQVDQDPFYAERFNATADVAEINRKTEEQQRVAELERPFRDAHLVENNLAGLPPGFVPADPISPSPPSSPSSREKPLLADMPADAATDAATLSRPATSPSRFNEEQSRPDEAAARLASTSDGATKILPSSQGSTASLSPLPPPSDKEAAAQATRQRHWIRQPD